MSSLQSLRGKKQRSSQKKAALLEPAKEEDLAIAKALIARHGFTSRGLQPELKVRGAGAAKPAANKPARKNAAKK